MLDANSLFSEEQGGFRSGRRCADQQLVLAEAIKSNARRGRQTFCAFMDVRKAFPSVFHKAMLQRLHQKISEAPGGDSHKCSKTWRVIEHMYSSCKSHVSIGGQKSDEYLVEQGIREGSVLSPVLFAIFIDDIVRRLNGCQGTTVGGVRVKVLLYADDIVLISENAQDLQCMIDICQKFADESSFQFSKEKSHVIVFGDQIDHPYEWTLNGDIMTEALRT